MPRPCAPPRSSPTRASACSQTAHSALASARRTKVTVTVTGATLRLLLLLPAEAVVVVVTELASSMPAVLVT